MNHVVSVIFWCHDVIDKEINYPMSEQESIVYIDRSEVRKGKLEELKVAIRELAGGNRTAYPSTDDCSQHADKYY